jgi:hypothetical protein
MKTRPDILGAPAPSPACFKSASLASTVDGGNEREQEHAGGGAGAPSVVQPAVSPATLRCSHASTLPRSCAFTLLEVMIACGIFFAATFAILALVSSTLRNARGLQKGDVDAGMAAAQIFQIVRTNKNADLNLSGDFGEAYPDFSWQAQSGQFDTNGLLEVDIVVNRHGLNKPVDSMSILVWSPDAKSRFQ